MFTISLRKREMKPGKSEASDGQKTSRARTEGGWQRQKTKSDAESIRRRTEEERTNREEADTQHHSALPSVVSTAVIDWFTQICVLCNAVR